METVKQVQNFIVLAEELHFARAAHRLGISQAALSNEIKKLELQVGCQLIDRSDRWMIKLTEAGSIYLREIKDIPDAIINAGQLSRKAARGETGTLSIGVAGFIYDYVDLGAICRNMLHKYPDVKLRIYDHMISALTRSSLRSGKCDIGFFGLGNISSDISSLNYRKLARIPLSFAIPASNPLAYKEELRIQDFKNSHFIFPPKEEAPRLRRHFEEFFLRSCHSEPLIVHEVAGGQASLQLVSAGLGIALVQYSPAVVNLKNVVLRQLPIGIERFVVAAWDENNTSQVLRNFISLLPVQSGLQ